MERDGSAAVGQPDRWLLIFHREAATPFNSFIALGKYKHVSALGFVAGADTWVYYDPARNGTHVAVARKGEGFRRLLDQVIGGDGNCDLMWFAPRDERPTFPPFFCCSTAVQHLIRLRGTLLRPDALWRKCLEHGGVVVEQSEKAGDAGHEPAVRPTSAAGSAG